MVEKHTGRTREGFSRNNRPTGLVDHDLNVPTALPTQTDRRKRSSTIGYEPGTDTSSNGHVRHERPTSHNDHQKQRRTWLDSDSAAAANVRGNRHLPIDSSVASHSRISFGKVEQLDKIIYERMVKSADRNNEARFMPINQLNGTISPANVQRELDSPKARKKLTKLRDQFPKLMDLSIDSAHLADIICKKPSRRKIFAVLCCMNKAHAILSFIEENVSDRDLPLEFDDELSGLVLRKKTDSKAHDMVNDKIAFFRDANWSPRNLESFKDLQWRFLVPNFILSYEGQSSKHLNFKPSHILPFIEDSPEAASLSKSVALEGGFSFVRKVRIHKAHHNHWKNPRGRGLSYFAVKELKTQPAQGLKEVRSLMRFNEQPHEHLIRLLSTFVYKESLHMIFHWADGNNLENFWIKTRSRPKEDFVLTRWMSKQISGLAEAIQRIHHCDDRLLPDFDKGKTHGRHGDLKPANILWFRHDPNDTSPGSFGILKISDFGMAEFHGPLSKSNIPADQVVGLSNVYRAPEFDNSRLISPRYDIWSFGCVLLEFAVWRTMGGYEHGVNRFSVLRTEESTAVIQEDNFFNLRLNSKEEVVEAEAKYSVINMFRTIRSHQACTGFVRDLLECIEQNLLQLEPEKRATCTAVMKKLQAINARCVSDQEYCIATVRIVHNECPSGLTNPVLMDLSVRMRKDLNLQPMSVDLRSTDQLEMERVREPDEKARIDEARQRYEILVVVFIVIAVFFASMLILVSSVPDKPIERVFATIYRGYLGSSQLK